MAKVVRVVRVAKVVRVVRVVKPQSQRKTLRNIPLKGASQTP